MILSVQKIVFITTYICKKRLEQYTLYAQIGSDPPIFAM
jgi:hypothetical protein